VSHFATGDCIIANPLVIERLCYKVSLVRLTTTNHIVKPPDDVLSHSHYTDSIDDETLLLGTLHSCRSEWSMSSVYGV
jgi:hypothetical protein